MKLISTPTELNQAGISQSYSWPKHGIGEMFFIPQSMLRFLQICMHIYIYSHNFFLFKSFNDLNFIEMNLGQFRFHIK